LNRIRIKGNVGRVDKCFVTPKGHRKATFSVADNHKDKSTDWYEIEAWEHLASQALMLEKGVSIELEGYVRKVEAYMKDGKPRPKITVGLIKIVSAVDLGKILNFRDDPVETEQFITAADILSTGPQ